MGYSNDIYTQQVEDGIYACIYNKRDVIQSKRIAAILLYIVAYSP